MATVNSASRDILGYMENNGFGTHGSNLFLFNQPTSPDQCLTLRDASGFDSDRTLDKYIWDKLSVQVIVRGKKNKIIEAEEKAIEIKNFLDYTTDIILNSTTYSSIMIVGNILPLGYDDSDRPEFSLNFKVERTYDI